MGLAAMLIAKILRLPHYSVYSTAFPLFAEQLTTDHNISELLLKYLIWFYNHTDRVFIPSYALGKEFEEKGIKKELMRKNAKAYVENRSFESVYLENWAYYDAAA
jgi:hypothetical protein